MADLSKDNDRFSKWVACWGNATSIIDQKECVYSKNLTLRYPVKMCFDGSRIRIHFSNLTGTEDVTLSEVSAAKESSDKNSGSYEPLPVTLNGSTSITIPAGKEILTDELSMDIKVGDVIDISFYLRDYTQMNAGTLITGPLSGAKYSYGNYASSKELPIEYTRSTSWFYFLNTIDIFTEEKNHALICYGDSITAQSWPDYLKLRCTRDNYNNVSIIRRAVSGTRILRQYDCITYQAYGLKGSVRFPIESRVAGADSIIIQHGINDIIHPVGVEVNPFRPWSDMPTVEDLCSGVRDIYVTPAKELGYKVYSGTLLPIYGWRTYTEERNRVRSEFNTWLRTADIFDGCVDFDEALRDKKKPEAFAPGFDSGDHLHPSEKAYEVMAESVPSQLLNY